jgi:hypothetical protein
MHTLNLRVKFTVLGLKARNIPAQAKGLGFNVIKKHVSPVRAK